MVDEKAIVYQAVKDYLTEEHPQNLEEFECVFESTYQTMASRPLVTDNEGTATDETAFAFDAGILDQAVVSLACVVAYDLVKAAVKYSATRDFPSFFDRLEIRLASATKNPKLIKAILDRVLGILQSL